MTDVTLITGASAGLGVEFAKQLAAEGQNLLLVARRADKLEALAQDLRARHKIEVFVEPSDLSASRAVSRLMAAATMRNLAVTGLINNAGFGLKGEFAQLDRARQLEMITLNCSVLTELCHAVLPEMIARKSGSILNVASTAAFQAGPLMAVYYASKAYVLSFSEALHDEVKQHGIHVSCLCPGPTKTDFFEVAEATKIGLTKLAGSPAKVVADGLVALKNNKAYVISGWLNKITAQSNRLTPRFVGRSIAKALQK